MKEFQCLYQVAGEVRTFHVWAEDKLDVQPIVDGLQLPAAVQIGGARDLIDWSKPTFNKPEAAAYLDVSETKIWELQCKGLLPRPNRNGHSVFHLRELEAYRRGQMRIDEWEADNKERRAA